MSRDALSVRVAELLRGRRHLPAPLTEREARDRLRPYGQGIVVGPLSPVRLNHARPSGPENLDGARGEQLVKRAGDSTS